MIILRYSSLHEFHMICVQINDGRNYLEQLKHLNTNKQKKNKSDKSCRSTKAPGAFSVNVMLDIDYFTDEPVVQCDVPVVKKYFCVLLQIKDANDK